MKQSWLWLACVLIGFALGRCEAQEMDDEQYRQLLEELTPNPADLWRQIPWQTSLLSAQREAAANRKPLFIWAMDGHPLGCT